ncbi:sodium:proline symporter [Longibacter salinarum]|uniref:Sodium:proline symporter n=1 Tax=Longibacter salinarum TaxID=1850348 RepID=A0A2A8CZI5_9BACT|nr:sodium:solute symporter family protein [Longibacter salinarum]PEN14021.1 sodium:proline symporter [Longibacter salinarum]
MQTIDWIIVVAYMVGALGLGAYLSRRASGSIEDFFVSGRSLPWWLAGTSMAATTFSIDTPLYVAGVVGTRGIAGNWEWWAFGTGHVVLIYVFARLWRRSEIVTDAELTEIRYGGRSAAILRGVKAFLFAIPINCIGIGLGMLAAVKVVGGLEIWQNLGFVEGQLILGADPKLLSIVGVSMLVLLYAGLSGLWGVVATDFFQFFLALFGAVLVAVFAIASPEVGGLSGLVSKAQSFTDFDVLAFTPLTFDPGATGWWGIGWSAVAGISATSFMAHVFLQWWTFRRSDGGGEFIQRLAASRDEASAEKAAWFFNIMHYVIRTWPWVLVALAAVVLYPDMTDPELAYPRLMLDFLPAGLLGIVVASLVAAFMSTVSTQINWGASYLTNDIYCRFLRPNASQAELVAFGRLASVVITVLGAAAAFYADSVQWIFQLVIAVGTGPGVVLILRWFWWRVNAWAELAAMGAGMAVGLLTSLGPATISLYGAGIPVEIPILVTDFGLRLTMITLVTTGIWIPVMYLTAPEKPETLNRFYRLVRPGGPGWKEQREATGLSPIQSLRDSLIRAAAAVLVLYGLMFAIGAALLLRPLLAAGLAAVAAVGGAVLYQRRGGPEEALAGTQSEMSGQG